MTKANIFVLKTSSEDKDERRLHQEECLVRYKSQTYIFRNIVNTKEFRLYLLRYFAFKVWNMISIENSTRKDSTSVEISKKQNFCDCKLCQD